MLVLNYGSNLSKEQFGRRCPTAKLVGNARLHGWRLTFTGWSGAWGASVATLLESPGHIAVGAVYELRSPEDVRSLDAAEGFPRCYGCHELTVEVKLEGRWRKRKVWAYLKVDQREGQPSNEYLKTIAQGYKDHGLDLRHLTDAITRLPAVWHRPPRPKRPRVVRPGQTLLPWTPKKSKVTKRGNVSKQGRNKGNKRRKQKQKRAQVVYVRPCDGLSGDCHEELAEPCSWCVSDQRMTDAETWHCAQCCPKTTPHTLLY